MTVHAHPDDESSKSAGTVSRYHDAGVRTVLVCCTGGEEGDILNPAMDTPAVRDNLPAVRREELARAAAVIGYDEVIMLGFRDSGMPGSEANLRPDCFARVPLSESAPLLAREIRRTRPDVVITYPDVQESYPHPDHIRTHEITLAAVELASDGSKYPEYGEPWSVQKLYYSVWSMAQIQATHEKHLELGLESPFEDWLTRPHMDDRITTRVDLTGYATVRRRALMAHATQVDPNSQLWFGLPEDVADSVHPFDEYILAASSVASDESTGDLFDGIG